MPDAATRTAAATPAQTRRAMDVLIARAEMAIRDGRDLGIVTGNNDADAVHLL